ncbi:glycosyltransferase [Algoriphagus sp. CAU 1675]|uniref:glycosyltransferase n=1 Tax=Algoriphagus sp. CAU 1675 TaxID=3032597 RepID=UPI0023D9A7E2|nr:glycosyltransferase [Algoriphagus sp. CAU 1675]MDF2159393.1 glycosyltransferase [Algoriphagus sp. CAU 1675]
MRTFQFLPLWEENGVQTKVSPFFSENYLNQLYAAKRPGISTVLASYLRRFGVLLTAFRYDLIWIEKELFPYLPPWAEYLLNRFGKPYVVDYDDAIFHNYDRSPNWLLRSLLAKKIDKVMKYSALVLAGNEYLESRAWVAGAGAVELLPTVIDPEKYRVKTEKGDKVTLGWIGSPTTLKYLASLKKVFEELAKKHSFRLLVVNAPGVRMEDINCDVTYIPWTEAGEVDLIQQMDIGMMPLENNKWERGKCAYKLIQYMACGLPVIASPVGVNAEVVDHGVNGYLADHQSEWVFYLSELINNPGRRRQMGVKGRSLVEEKYTREKNFQKMKSLVEKLLK